MGLHGKSFIPLIMGFGCNVPAIMSSRIIESRKARLVTMLVNPLMSCSARLPIYLVMIGAFFPGKASLILLSIYAIGILLAVLMARIFTKFLVKGDDSPFVMELPPYRMPTAKVVLRHTWEKGKQYLKKMGGIIMVAPLSSGSWDIILTTKRTKPLPNSRKIPISASWEKPLNQPSSRWDSTGRWVSVSCRESEPKNLW